MIVAPPEPASQPAGRPATQPAGELILSSACHPKIDPRTKQTQLTPVIFLFFMISAPPEPASPPAPPISRINFRAGAVSFLFKQKVNDVLKQNNEFLTVQYFAWIWEKLDKI